MTGGCGRDPVVAYFLKAAIISFFLALPAEDPK